MDISRNNLSKKLFKDITGITNSSIGQMLQSSLVNCLQLWIILLVLVKNPKNMNGPFQRHSRPLEAHKVSSVPLVNPNQGGIGSTCAVCTSPHLFYKSHDDKLADLVTFHSHWDQGQRKYFLSFSSQVWRGEESLLLLLAFLLL